MAGNGDGSRQSGRFDTYQIDCIGSHIISNLDFEILDYPLVIYPFGQDSGVIADVICFVNVRPQLGGALSQVVHIFLGNSVIAKVTDFFCVRANNHITVYGVCHMDSHVSVAGHRVDWHGKKGTSAFVQDDVISFGTNDLVSGDSQHVRNFLAAQSGGVYHPAAGKISMGCGKKVMIVCVPADFCNFPVKEILHTVLAGIFRQSDGILERV